MQQTLASRIESITAKIERSCAKADRNKEDVHLLAVSKTVPIEVIQEASSYGLSHFGENRVEEAIPKIKQCPDLDWHFIGHLQSRKAKLVIPLFSLIHSIDSLKLIEILNNEAQKQGRHSKVRILLEVNIAEEEAKYGFSEAELWDALPQLELYPLVGVEGLMTMAPLSSDPETSRPVFRRLRELKDEIGAKSYPFLKMETLSMGMSQDFEVAIEEGANWVRIGSALFKGSDIG